MTHITTEEIIAFVSFDKFDDETKRLVSKVNSHIAKCNECLERVRAFQTVYDAIGELDAETVFGGIETDNELEKCAQDEEIEK